MNQPMNKEWAKLSPEEKKSIIQGLASVLHESECEEIHGGNCPWDNEPWDGPCHNAYYGEALDMICTIHLSPQFLDAMYKTWYTATSAIKTIHISVHKLKDKYQKYNNIPRG